MRALDKDARKSDRFTTHRHVASAFSTRFSKARGDAQLAFCDERIVNLQYVAGQLLSEIQPSRFERSGSCSLVQFDQGQLAQRANDVKAVRFAFLAGGTRCAGRAWIDHATRAGLRACLRGLTAAADPLTARLTAALPVGSSSAK